MKTYILSLGAVAVMAALLDLILPEGEFKKYVRLVLGMLVIAVAIAPLGALRGETPTLPDWEMFTLDEEAAQLQMEQSVLEAHRANMEALIRARAGANSRVFVEVSEDGTVSRVTVRGASRESDIAAYLEQEIGVGKEQVTIEFEDTHSDG